MNLLLASAAGLGPLERLAALAARGLTGGGFHERSSPVHGSTQSTTNVVIDWPFTGTVSELPAIAMSERRSKFSLAEVR
jgi:hypothetical protein